MSNDSTGKNGGLSLAEQARFGLLPDALHIEQIATLEHPDDWAVRKAFALCLLQACENAEIPSISGLQYDDGWIDDPQGLRLWWKPLHLNENGPTPMVSRQAYRAWQAQCPKSWLSERSKIDEWLGATPAVETIPPALPTLPEQTATTARPAEPSIPKPIAKGGAAEKSRKTIALVEMENAALVALRKELEREPDFDEFWDYLITRDDTGTVADFTDDGLCWIGKTSKSCETEKSTFRNRLTKAKKRNPFKPS